MGTKILWFKQWRSMGLGMPFLRMLKHTELMRMNPTTWLVKIMRRRRTTRMHMRTIRRVSTRVPYSPLFDPEFWIYSGHLNLLVSGHITKNRYLFWTLASLIKFDYFSIKSPILNNLKWTRIYNICSNILPSLITPSQISLTFTQVPESLVVKAGLLLTDPKVDGSNPGRANQNNPFQ
jgi:hypothetical protein